MKVLLLAISDSYWARFVNEYSTALSAAEFEVVVVMESRLGEYRQYGKRQYYDACSTYYLTDFFKDNSQKLNKESFVSNHRSVFSDFLRLTMLNGKNLLKKTDFRSYEIIVNNFFSMIFEEHEDISCIIHDQVSSAFSYICWNQAQTKNIKYIGLGGGRIPGRVEIKESPLSESFRVEALFDEIVSNNFIPDQSDAKSAENYIKNIENITPDYMRLSPLSNPSITNVLSKQKVLAMINTIKYCLIDDDAKFMKMLYKFPVLEAWYAAKRNLIRLLRIFLYKDYFRKISDDWIENNQFFIFPIHFQPEATSCVEAQYYSDQLIVLRNIAFSLPSNVKLLVKEHQTNFGYVHRDFYETIQSFPNTLLIGPTYNLKSLINKSLGVITLNSTAGLEALMMNKPVVVFGDVFYAFHKNCYTVDGWSNFTNIINKLLNSYVANDNYQYNLNFVLAYFRSTMKGVIDFERPYFGIEKQLIEYMKNIKNFNGKHET